MSKYKVSLFYSYCHKDEYFRQRMETALTLLNENGVLVEWSDRKITLGTPFSPQIIEKLDSAELVVFLISPDFLASEPCKDEWKRAKKNAVKTGQRLVPIILKECSWMDFDNMKEYLALPRDGRPIERWDNENVAWQDVYEQIKIVLESIRNTFEVKEEFRRQICEVDFVSKSEMGIELDDLFIFPNLVLDGKFEREISDRRVNSFDELEDTRLALIRGDVLSGKTTLCRKLFLHLTGKGQPAILIDLEEAGSRKPSSEFLREAYRKQMKGDYISWSQRPGKTIIFDNLTVGTIRFLEFAKKDFENIIVTTSDDDYLAYFADDRRVSEFKQFRLQHLRHSMQEDLIRKWMNLNPSVESGQIEVYDGKVSQVEKRVNSIFLNRIVPRFPFFVLSILQTYEGYVPQDLTVTAYGHCYQALIVAHLLKSGHDNGDIETCFNLLGELAYTMCQVSDQSNTISEQEYGEFLEYFEKKYLRLKKALRNRLIGQPTSILSNEDGQVRFSWSYSYYFFLGLYISGHYEENDDLVADMVDKSYLKDNALSLMFLIHHSNSPELIEDILLHTMCIIDGRTPVRLDNEEIGAFEGILQKLPSDIATDQKVDEVRAEERNIRDELDEEEVGDPEESAHDFVNELYKALKNIDILSQIIKNKSGSLERTRIYEIIETITDTALRLASVFLLDSSEIDELARICKKRLDEETGGTPPSEEAIKDELGFYVFVLVMSSIEKAVSSIDRKEVRDVVEELCVQRDTPAYDLIHSFYLIDIADRLSKSQLNMTRKKLKKHKKNGLVKRALPIRVQFYLNSHRVADPIQSAFRDLFESLDGRRRRSIAAHR